MSRPFFFARISLPIALLLPFAPLISPAALKALATRLYTPRNPSISA